MKRFSLFTILFFTTLLINAQNVKGYYISVNGQRNEGFFKQVNFYNENNLYFKASESAADYTKIDPGTVQEYGAGDDVVFRKYTVKLDDSKLMGTDHTTEKMAVWVTRTVFMNVILEGEASLYSYSSDKGVKYFYAVKGKGIGVNQLVYKQYMVKQAEIGENNQFRQQLYNDVSCPGAKAGDFAHVKYEKKELEKIFGKYNGCMGKTTETKEFSAETSKKVIFSVTLLAGAGSVRTEISNITPIPGSVNNIGFTGGAEAALTLPSGMFSFFFKGLYENLSSENKVTTVSTYRTSTDTYTLKTDFVDFYVGPRYNFNFNKVNTLFADASFAVAVPSGTASHKHETTTTDGTVSYLHDYRLKSDMFYSAGVGYQYNNKYGVELHTDFSRDFQGADMTSIKLGRLWVNLRYTF